MLRRHRCLVGAILAALSLGQAAPARASTADECIRSYIHARKNPAKSLDLLRRCATEHADSAVIQLTLGRRLLRDFDKGLLEGKARGEALVALQRAASLDPDRVGEDWLKIAQLLDEKGDRGGCLRALGAAEAYLPRAEREATEERRWAIAVELGDTTTALQAWDRIRFRHSRDFEAQVTAGRLFLGADDSEAARLSFERALDLRPGDPAAAEPLCRMLLDERREAGDSDRKLMLDTCRPALERLEPDELEALIEAALNVYRIEAAEELATFQLSRESESATAHLVLSERALRELLETRKWSESHQRDIVEHARSALRGNLPPDRLGRAHAVLGTALSYRALARYRSDGPVLTGKILSHTRAALREALGHLGRAQAEGEPVEGEIRELREALRRVGVLDAEVEQAKLERRIARCESLKRLSRQSRETGRPLMRTNRRAVELQATADSEAAITRLDPDRRLRLIDAQWTGVECRCRVKTDDGTTGWLPLTELD